jgi:phospholipase C
VIVSPWVKRRFVDSRVASFSSMLAFTEHTFGLAPLSNRDANAYDYSNAFNFQQRPLSPVPMTHTRLSSKSRAAVRDNPVNPSGDT